jgi:hypothetical protein
MNEWVEYYTIRNNLIRDETGHGFFLLYEEYIDSDWFFTLPAMPDYDW